MLRNQRQRQDLRRRLNLRRKVAYNASVHNKYSRNLSEPEVNAIHTYTTSSGAKLSHIGCTRPTNSRRTGRYVNRINRGLNKIIDNQSCYGGKALIRKLYRVTNIRPNELRRFEQCKRTGKTYILRKHTSFTTLSPNILRRKLYYKNKLDTIIVEGDIDVFAGDITHLSKYDEGELLAPMNTPIEIISIKKTPHITITARVATYTTFTPTKRLQ